MIDQTRLGLTRHAGADVQPGHHDSGDQLAIHSRQVPAEVQEAQVRAQQVNPIGNKLIIGKQVNLSDNKSEQLAIGGGKRPCSCQGCQYTHTRGGRPAAAHDASTQLLRHTWSAIGNNRSTAAAHLSTLSCARGMLLMFQACSAHCRSASAPQAAGCVHQRAAKHSNGHTQQKSDSKPR